MGDSCIHVSLSNQGGQFVSSCGKIALKIKKILSIECVLPYLYSPTSVAFLNLGPVIHIYCPTSLHLPSYHKLRVLSDISLKFKKICIHTNHLKFKKHTYMLILC
jgi:hypothetical protein